METRSYGLTLNLEERDGQPPVLRGHAAVFNETADLGRFTEEVLPKAFSRSLETADVRALVNHDRGRVVARSKAGTLRLREDERGLAVEIDPPNSPEGQNVVEAVRRGDLSGMSFGFKAKEDHWSERSGRKHRKLVDVELFEVSLVAWPAYPGTDISLRSAEEAYNQHEQERLRQRLAALARRARIVTL